MIDRKFKPWLLETNCSPSFGTDAPLDYKIKKNVIADALKLLNFDHAKRKEWIKKNEEDTELRMRTGKVNRLSREERMELKKQKLSERFQFESTRMGGYELIFPCADKDMNKSYEAMIKKSNDFFDDFVMGKNKRKHMEQEKHKKEKQLAAMQRVKAQLANNQIRKD